MKRMLYFLRWMTLCSMVCAIGGCSISKTTIPMPEKIDPAALREDLSILNKALKTYHPSLYAYTTKVELEKAFHNSIESIHDSLTAADFAYKMVAPFVARIRCGHTSVSLSARFRKYQQKNPPAGFPLFLKFFGDTMLVARNLHRSDTLLKKGTQILSINGLDSRSIQKRLFESFPMDGYAASVNLARVNNNFPFYHRMVMGVDSTYSVVFIDKNKQAGTSVLRAYNPGQQQQNKPSPKTSTPKSSISARRDLELRLDTGSSVAYMYMANFDHPIKSHRFIRKSFKTLKRHEIEHLIIDLRSNGGGVIDNEVFLAKHLRKSSFRVADSAVAIKRGFHGDGKYFRNEWINGLIIKLFTRKDENGFFHMSKYWEKRQFKPVPHRFFDGQIYIMTGGMTFSAASLFCLTMKGQDNVTLVGEETGGSAYANNGLLIPDFVLPNSRVKVRMPLFRLVPDSTAINNGRGVMPDIPVSPSSASFMGGYDPVMTTTLSLIRKFKSGNNRSSDRK
jgi:hypothetical protein